MTVLFHRLRSASFNDAGAINVNAWNIQIVRCLQIRNKEYCWISINTYELFMTQQYLYMLVFHLHFSVMINATICVSSLAIHYPTSYNIPEHYVNVHTLQQKLYWSLGLQSNTTKNDEIGVSRASRLLKWKQRNNSEENSMNAENWRLTAIFATKKW